MRFHLGGYNRIQQQAAWQLYQDWTGANFPRVLLIEIQHATPYYDDSYAVNSENNGPYGDAIMRELVPEIERRFRGIGQGWARFTYGGSTGGWEAMAVQMFYPDEFNGAWIACPDPIDFRQYTVVNIYEDTNAYLAARAGGSASRAQPIATGLATSAPRWSRRTSSSASSSTHGALGRAVGHLAGGLQSGRGGRISRSRSGTSAPA